MRNFRPKLLGFAILVLVAGLGVSACFPAFAASTTTSEKRHSHKQSAAASARAKQLKHSSTRRAATPKRSAGHPLTASHRNARRATLAKSTSHGKVHQPTMAMHSHPASGGGKRHHFNPFRRRHRHAVVGQRSMDPQRATEIQQALIQAHYLSGQPTGQWDQATQAAMMKYQTDNGWQSKITPDSRALIKLGLGPKQDEGEYVSTPSGSAANAAPADTVGAMANSALPSTGQP